MNIDFVRSIKIDLHQGLCLEMDRVDTGDGA